MRFRNLRWARRGERIIGATVTTLAAALASLAAAAEAPASTVTFEYTGAPQTWTVPDGVTSATFDVYGAAGGMYIFGGGTAPGGRATATLAVTPGDSYQINVGQRGQGGSPAYGGGAPGGGGGGGASDVRFGGAGLTDRIIVAGGGGGGGFCSDGGSNFTRGGSGGGLAGGDAIDPCGDFSGEPGRGGTQSAGGAGGGDGSPGSFGIGGAGGAPDDSDRPGGGGGGWYGGGGGSGAIAGGGGSGHGPPGTVFETGVRQGDGLITITYDEPAPPVDEPPRILSLAVSPNRFAAGTRDTSLTRRAGARMEIDLSEAASVRFRVRRNPRRRTGTPPPRRARAFTRDLPAGESSVEFTGRLDGRAFKPGRYAIVARATDPAGQRSDKATAAFRIVGG